MNEQTPVLGGLSSGEDYRDRYASAVAAASAPAIILPDTFHTDLGPDLYQRLIPACVSHNVVYLARLYWYKRTGRWIDFSPRYLDILSAEPWIPLDGGRRPRYVLKIAATRGICTTATLPNDTTLSIAEYRNPAAITAAANAEAAQYKIPGYFAVDLDTKTTRLNIYLHGAITTLFEIGEEFWTPSWNDSDIDPLRTPKTVVSGHQLAPNGWTGEKYNTLRNEWSIHWANNDEAQYDPIAWNKNIIEQWAIAEIPDDVKTFLSNLPAPSDFHHQWDTNLQRGMPVSEDVKMMQVAFMILGLMTPPPPEELGYFGPKTAVANDRFQRLAGITNRAPDHFGPQSRAYANKLFAL